MQYWCSSTRKLLYKLAKTMASSLNWWHAVDKYISAWWNLLFQPEWSGGMRAVWYYVFTQHVSSHVDVVNSATWNVTQSTNAGSSDWLMMWSKIIGMMQGRLKMKICVNVTKTHYDSSGFAFTWWGFSWRICYLNFTVLFPSPFFYVFSAYLLQI